MTIEEAIETIEYARAFNEENTLLMKAWDLIIDYVRAQSANDGQMKSDGWISVKDRLPEPDKEVLLIAHGWTSRTTYIGSLHHTASKKSWMTGIESKESDWQIWGWSYLKEPHVTHWMPLPKPPKSEGGDEP